MESAEGVKPDRRTSNSSRRSFCVWQKLGAHLFVLRQSVVCVKTNLPLCCGLFLQVSWNQPTSNQDSLFGNNSFKVNFCPTWSTRWIGANDIAFASRKLQNFASSWGFRITSSSPRYPQSKDRVVCTWEGIGCTGKLLWSPCETIKCL